MALLLASLVLAALAQEGGVGSLKEEERELMELRQKVQLLEESLALANTEADYFHGKWVELRLQHEALGVDALTGDESAIRDKVVSLLGELFQSEKRRSQYEKALREVVKSMRAYEKASSVDKTIKRAELEAALRSASRILNVPDAGVPMAKDLTDGKVIRYDSELAIVHANFGHAQGVKEGMPFRIVRKNKVIGRCTVIEVRDYLTTLLVEDLVQGVQIQKDDRLLLETVAYGN